MGVMGPEPLEVGWYLGQGGGFTGALLTVGAGAREDTQWADRFVGSCYFKLETEERMRIEVGWNLRQGGGTRGAQQLGLRWPRSRRLLWQPPSLGRLPLLWDRC